MKKDELKPIDISCPYCDCHIRLLAPKGAIGNYKDVEVVPYTRDVGRFDPPEDEVEHDNPERWSAIGSDYLKFLLWERIGILRVREKDISIKYRVQRCTDCKNLFDVYVNYTEEKELKTLWPHLFARYSNVVDDAIRKYYGESWPIWLVRKLGGIFRSNNVGALAIGALLFVLAVFTRIAEMQSELDINSIVLFGIVSLSISILLLLQDRYVHFMETTDDFEKLFSIHRPRYGLNHWRNYVVSRFVGVQDGKLPELTQVDIVSGGISILLLIIVWLLADFTNNKWGLVWFFLVLGISVTAIWTYKNIEGKKNSKKRKSQLLGSVFLFVILLTLLYFQVRKDILVVAVAFFEIVFWSVFAYVLGISGLLSLNTSFYVLDGLTRIPMKLNPYNNFKHINPLRRLESFSTGILLILFVSIVFIFSIVGLELSEQYYWLINWLRLILVFLLIAAGFALNRGEYFGGAVVYFLITYLPSWNEFVPGLLFDTRVIVLGFFFTLIVGFQILKTDDTIAGLLEKAKSKELRNLDERVRSITVQILKIEEKIKNSKPGERVSELSTQRQSNLESIECLLRLRDRIEQINVRPFQFRRLSEFLTPFFSSVLFPLLDLVGLFEIISEGIQS